MNHRVLNQLLSPGDRLIVIDGGARGGPSPLTGLGALCQFYCFEPSPSQLQAIQEAVSGTSTTAYPYAICGTSGTTTLNISRRPGATSTLEPNPEILDRFAADHFSEMQDIVERVQVPAISMGDFMQQANLSAIDFLKLDTQGNELDIIKSMGDALDKVSVIETEVEMLPLYKGQPLFHDVSQFLYSRGFELVDIRHVPACRRFHARGDLPPSAYRLVWGDAIYARKPADATKSRALHQALVLAGLGYADMAIDLFDRNPQLTTAQKRDLEIFARQAAEPQHLTGRIKRLLERQLGLLIQRYPWKKGQQLNSKRPDKTPT
jgi:FkbM family methyltransferase